MAGLQRPSCAFGRHDDRFRTFDIDRIAIGQAAASNAKLWMPRGSSTKRLAKNPLELIGNAMHRKMFFSGGPRVVAHRRRVGLHSIESVGDGPGYILAAVPREAKARGANVLSCTVRGADDHGRASRQRFCNCGAKVFLLAGLDNDGSYLQEREHGFPRHMRHEHQSVGMRKVINQLPESLGEGKPTDHGDPDVSATIDQLRARAQEEVQSLARNDPADPNDFKRPYGRNG
jgi:hypothetical protein